jgi:hypothetical protein
MLLRESGVDFSLERIERLQRLHGAAYNRISGDSIGLLSVGMGPRNWSAQAPIVRMKIPPIS